MVLGLVDIMFLVWEKKCFEKVKFKVCYSNIDVNCVCMCLSDVFVGTNGILGECSKR